MPSVALTGANGGENLDLGGLHPLGVVVAGHLAGFDGRHALSPDALQTTVAHADLRLQSLLGRIDAHIEAHHAEAPSAEPVRDVRVPDGPAVLDLDEQGISTIVWATGYGRDYGWLQARVL